MASRASKERSNANSWDLDRRGTDLQNSSRRLPRGNGYGVIAEDSDEDEANDIQVNRITPLVHRHTLAKGPRKTPSRPNPATPQSRGSKNVRPSKLPNLVQDADRPADAAWRQNKEPDYRYSIPPHVRLRTYVGIHDQIDYIKRTTDTMIELVKNGQFFLLWGNKPAINAAIKELEKLIDGLRRPALKESKFAKVENLAPLARSMREEEEQRRSAGLQFKKRPTAEIKSSATAIGFASWPENPYPPMQILGPQFEALDPVRERFQVWIDYDSVLGGFKAFSFNAESVRHATNALKGVYETAKATEDGFEYRRNLIRPLPPLQAGSSFKLFQYESMPYPQRYELDQVTQSRTGFIGDMDRQAPLSGDELKRYRGFLVLKRYDDEVLNPGGADFILQGWSHNTQELTPEDFQDDSDPEGACREFNALNTVDDCGMIPDEANMSFAEMVDNRLQRALEKLRYRQGRMTMNIRLGTYVARQLDPQLNIIGGKIPFNRYVKMLDNPDQEFSVTEFIGKPNCELNVLERVMKSHDVFVNDNLDWSQLDSSGNLKPQLTAAFLVTAIADKRFNYQVEIDFEVNEVLRNCAQSNCRVFRLNEFESVSPTPLEISYTDVKSGFSWDLNISSAMEFDKTKSTIILSWIDGVKMDFAALEDPSNSRICHILYRSSPGIEVKQMEQRRTWKFDLEKTHAYSIKVIRANRCLVVDGKADMEAFSHARWGLHVENPQWASLLPDTRQLNIGQVDTRPIPTETLFPRSDADSANKHSIDCLLELLMSISDAVTHNDRDSGSKG